MRIKITFLVVAFLFSIPLVQGKVLVVGEDGFKSILDALYSSSDGDKILIKGGTYRENLHVNKSIALEAEGEVVIDGSGSGSVLVVSIGSVTIKGLTITGSGVDLVQQDSCIFLEKSAENTVIEGNVLRNCTFGVWVNGASNVTITGNRISGRAYLPSPLRGNGIHLWDADNAHVYNNIIKESRDGIYISVSEGTILRNNTISHLRYGVHYMYSDNCIVENITSYNNRAGLALMFSKNLIVKGNKAQNNTRYGIMFRDVVSSLITGNVVVDNKVGLFLYNSLHNQITDTLVIGNSIGAHVWSGSEENEVYNNSFIRNKNQMKYVGASDQEWSFEGRGNYWSDYTGWDADGDGVGDIQYRPITLIERLVWKYPLVKLLMNSPAAQSIRMAESQFPVFQAPSIVDSHPIMEPAHDWRELIEHD
jgi:nitrous oxidase accessory protein